MKNKYGNGYVFDNGITLIEYVDSQYARCMCHCGNEFTTRVYDVEHGRTNSCGHCPTIKLEDFDNDTYKLVYIGRGRYKGAEGYIAKEWYHFLTDVLGVSKNWTAKKSSSAKTLYWQSMLNGDYIRIHTLIGVYFLGCDNIEYTIDHIDNDELNNSRFNVRRANRTQQAYNTTRNRETGKYTGVGKSYNMYYMRCNVNGKTLYFSPFENEHIAALAKNFVADVLGIKCMTNIVPKEYSLTKDQKRYILTKLKENI